VLNNEFTALNINSYPGHAPMRPCGNLFRPIIVLALLLGGCASAQVEVHHPLEENIIFPKTVAILPFTIAEDVREKENLPHNIFREVFFNYFSYLGYTDVPLATIDKRLNEYGVTVSPDPQEMDLATLKKALNADAVVMGHILGANNFTGGIHAETMVHAKLVMLDLTTGESVWDVDHTEMSYSGIAASSVVDIIQGQMENSKVKQAYYKSVEMFSMQVIKQVPDPAKLRYGEVQLPTITRIETNIHPGRKLGANDLIQVSLYGQPGLKATFDIGSWRTSINMKEVAPGLYTGSYQIEAGDQIENAFIIGTLKNNDGLASKKFYKSALANIDGGDPVEPKEDIPDMKRKLTFES
jgi:hypothetical protein